MAGAGMPEADEGRSARRLRAESAEESDSLESTLDGGEWRRPGVYYFCLAGHHDEILQKPDRPLPCPYLPTYLPTYPTYVCMYVER